MDRGGVTAVESLIKLHDGKYASALQAHLDQFKIYKKNGGKLKRRQFNKAVSKAMRDDVSEIPEALAASRTWRSELYDPLKNEAVSVGLLPEDIEVSTAVNYLNRRWNKDKIAANQPDFEQRVARWLKEEDLKLFSQAKQAQDDIATATGAEKTRLQKLIDRAEYKLI
jgi:hypothetical protein